jgi:hypothetical protein
MTVTKRKFDQVTALRIRAFDNDELFVKCIEPMINDGRVAHPGNSSHLVWSSPLVLISPMIYGNYFCIEIRWQQKQNNIGRYRNEWQRRGRKLLTQ